MAYNKYKLFKKQVSYDGGVTWTDVTPLETIASGAPIASYATLEECEAGALYRLYAVVNGGDDYILYCTGLESDAVLGGYDKNYENIPYSTKLNVTSGYVGNCVTKLGDGTSSNETAGVFSRCSGLTNVNMSDSVTEYGDYSFRMCKSLQSVPSSSGLTKIGNYCFAQCSGFTSINIPQTVTSIGNAAFISCSNATSITWPTGTTTVGDGVFHSCFGLTSVTIPSNIIASADNSYGDMSSAFRNCSGLTSCTVNNGIVAQGEFAACTGLRDANLNGVTKIGNDAFNSCINLTGLTLPNTLTSIGAGAFQNCSGITSIDIPNSVTSIGNSAFQNCSGLTSINIPDSITSIEQSTFQNCTGLTNVTIGSGVTNIDFMSFYGCSGLTAITVNATTPPTISNWSFYGTNDCPIYVPAASVNTYKSATNWSTYASRIQAIPT